MARQYDGDPSVTLTPGEDVFRGSDGSDIVATYLSNLSREDWIAAAGGTDVLRVLSARAVVKAGDLAGLRSVEVLDVSRASDGIAIALDGHAVSQSGSGALKVYGYDRDIFLDTSGVGGAGTVRVATSGSTTLADSAGQSVAVDSASRGAIIGGASGDRIAGGAFHDNLAGQDGNDVLDGNGGDDAIYGGRGTDLIRTGEGSDTVAGGAGGDTFVVAAQSGAVTGISDFDTQNPLERIDLRDFSSAKTFGGLSISSHNGDAVIHSGTSQIVLAGVAVADLKPDDFILAGQTGINVFAIAAGTSETLIQEVIDSAPAGAIIELAAGTFSFDQTLRIERSDITVRGAGSGKTVIVSRIPDSDASATIKVASGGEGPVMAKLAADANVGARSLTLTSTAGLKAGDIIRVAQANDRAWLDATGNDQIHTDTPPLREMLVKITGISGNRIAVSEPAPYAFEAQKATVAALNPLDHVALGGFRIETRFGRADPNDFTNTMAAWDGAATFEVDRATASRFYDIGIYDSASTAFLFNEVYAISGDRLHAEGAQNKGGDGNGYAFHLHSAFANTLTDLSDRDMRHGVLFSSWHAEHYNFITVASTNRDINFHGSPDADNTVRVARMVMEFGGADQHEAAAVQPGVYPKHPLSTIAANDVTFKYLRSVDRSDIVHADDSGADIATGGRDDVIFGGAGADRLDGGPGDDVMRGGGSADRFIRHHGDGSDTITDFKAGSGGDRIELDDYAFRSFAELRIEQHGSDAVLNLGADGTMRLKGVDASDLTAANFTFADDQAAGMTGKVTDAAYFVGSDGSDLIEMSPTALKSGATIVLGGGHDTIATGAAAGLTLDAATFRHFDGVDELDVSGVDKLYLKLDDAFLAQSDDGTVTVTSGSSGIDRLDVGKPRDGLAVLLDGRGTVHLADGRGHAVRIADDAQLAVAGGDGADELRGGNGDEALSGRLGNDFISGGGGADRLSGGSGADTFVFKSGYGKDTIVDFGETTDRLAIDHLLLQGRDLADYAHQSGSDVVFDFSARDVLTVASADIHTMSSWNVDLV
jgi:Ca2+-binding RTX toxin-like protein